MLVLTLLLTTNLLVLVDIGSASSTVGSEGVKLVEGTNNGTHSITAKSQIVYLESTFCDALNLVKTEFLKISSVVETSIHMHAAVPSGSFTIATLVLTTHLLLEELSHLLVVRVLILPLVITLSLLLEDATETNKIIMHFRWYRLYCTSR